ncbi:MAG: hypothetical protein K0M45_12260 [Candidatus Paracaedibacteraceae bacterium]|nr:hypothetical protein [Candidatus Paracaedibacteraceae bacterium]
MKNRFLTLSFMFLTITKVAASQGGEEDGGIMVPSSPRAVAKPQEESRGDRMLDNTVMTDAYELAEKSDDLFNKKKLKEAAQLRIAAALQGHEESKDFLIDIDPNSLEFLSSTNTQSVETSSYYETVLIPNLIREMEKEYAKLEKYKDVPVILPNRIH